MTNAKKIKVTILKQTSKAFYVQNEAGQECWVQNRSYKDGYVNANVFLKSAKFLEETKAAKKAAAEDAQNYYAIGAAVRESDKAIAVKCTWEEEFTDATGSELVWFPKSQIVNGNVKKWLISLKIEEVIAKLRKECGNKGCFTCQVGDVYL